MNFITLKQELERINPAMLEYPPDFHYEAAAQRAQELRDALEQSFQRAFDLDLGIQDATFYAQLGIPPALCLDQKIPQPAIRLSNFHNLAVITAEEKLIPETQVKVQQSIASVGLQYIPFSVFGTSFSQTQRFAGDLFYQLFDYM